jgi:hypothetical protein
MQTIISKAFCSVATAFFKCIPSEPGWALLFVALSLLVVGIFFSKLSKKAKTWALVIVYILIIFITFSFFHKDILGIVAAFTALIALPMTQHWYNQPVIKLDVRDNHNGYWHILIKNEGGAVNKGALYLAEVQKGKDRQLAHSVRFNWPYESGEPDRAKERSIIKSQVDFFYSGPYTDAEKNQYKGHIKEEFLKKDGHLCLTFPPSKGDWKPLADIPEEEQDEPLYVRVELIGENYQSPDNEWFCIRKTSNDKSGWSIKKESPPSC